MKSISSRHDLRQSCRFRESSQQLSFVVTNYYVMNALLVGVFLLFGSMDVESLKFAPPRFNKLVAAAGFVSTGFVPMRPRVGTQTQIVAQAPQENVKRESPGDIWKAQRRPEEEKTSRPSLAQKANPSSVAGISKMGHQTAFVRDAVKAVGASVVRVDCEREVPPMQVLMNPGQFKGTYLCDLSIGMSPQ